MPLGRNRVYAPGIGRFLQRDPNAAGMTLIASALMHGRSIPAIAAAFSMEGMYSDGGSLYQYLGSNPTNRSDVLGLSTDPFDMVDDFLAIRLGSIGGLMSAFGKDLQAAAIVGATIISMLPFPLASIAGDLALYAMGDQSMAMTLGAIALGVIPGGKLLGKLGPLLSRVGASAWRAGKHYAGMFGGFVARTAGSVVNRAKKWLRRKPARVACGCFTAGTLVWTAAGQIPIQDVGIGDWVLARDADSAMVYRQVSDEIVVRNTAIVYLTIEHSDGGTETISTTDEHPFWVDDGRGFTRADALVPGDVLKAVGGDSLVRQVKFSSDRTTVYNLTVDDASTYLVGPDGVWVHNCDIIQLGKLTPDMLRLSSDWVVDASSTLIQETGTLNISWRLLQNNGTDRLTREMQGNALEALIDFGRANGATSLRISATAGATSVAAMIRRLGGRTEGGSEILELLIP